MKSLRTLELSSDGGIAALWTLPSLHTLLIDNPYKPGLAVKNPKMSTLTSMIQRSQCPLRRIAIKSSNFKAYIDKEEIISLLQHTPLLANLHVTVSALSPSFFRAISRTREKDPLVPALENLHLSLETRCPPATIDAMLAFLESRFQATASSSHHQLISAAVALDRSGLAAPSRSYRLKKLTDAGLAFDAL
ncbi:hypothetical protein HGRIS_005024 [Hohenbuehelia grisea]|uniref:Uncharacterized protein n=1 Tax=Hohenbuehelia grisea TaxID=104357 RepID=A0ABR3JEK4_9AGAR